MWKTALLVLAVSLLFPLLASRAAPPEDCPPALDQGACEPAIEAAAELLAQLPPANPEDDQEAELQEELMNLHTQYLAWRRLQQPEPALRSTVCLAGSGDSICAVAAEVARMRPCLTASDCPAARAWEEAMGQMGVRPAPRTMTRASVQPAPEIDRPEHEHD